MFPIASVTLRLHIMVNMAIVGEWMDLIAAGNWSKSLFSVYGETPLRCCMSFRIASTQATAVPVQRMIGLGRGCARATATVRFLSLLPERSVEQLCRTMFFATKSLPPAQKAPTNYRGAISPCKSVTMFGAT